MKAQPCNLIFHGSCKEIPMGEFPSKAAAKRFVTEGIWVRPYSIIPIKTKKK